MKAIIQKVWSMPFLTIDGDTFTVGECVLTWAGIIAGIVLLGLAGFSEIH
jgi:hypothetical protein